MRDRITVKWLATISTTIKGETEIEYFRTCSVGGRGGVTGKILEVVMSEESKIIATGFKSIRPCYLFCR